MGLLEVLKAILSNATTNIALQKKVNDLEATKSILLAGNEKMRQEIAEAEEIANKIAEEMQLPH